MNKPASVVFSMAYRSSWKFWQALTPATIRHPLKPRHPFPSIAHEENPIGATDQMRTWYTTKPCFPTTKSHISHLVGDSAWEGHAANVFEKRDEVLAYAKNDHLGFQIYYMWAGSRRRYVPDFLVRLAGGTILALEIKGTDSPQNKAKRDALNEWVRAINAAGGFGRWAWDVAFKPGEVQDIVSKHAAVAEPVA